MQHCAEAWVLNLAISFDSSNYGIQVLHISVKKLTVQPNTGRVIWKGDPNIWHAQDYIKKTMKNTKENSKKHLKKVFKTKWKTICWRLMLGTFFPM